MKYVIVSTNSNPAYSNFWPLISKRWISFGYKPVLVKVSTDYTKESFIDYNTYSILKIKIKPGNEGIKSQLSRIYAIKFLPDVPVLISDIDLYPLNKEYYDNLHQLLNKNNIVINNYKHYHKFKHWDGIRDYQMCHVLSYANIQKRLYELKEFNSFTIFYNQISKRIASFINKRFRKLGILNLPLDEIYLTLQVNKYINNIPILRTRYEDLDENEKLKYKMLDRIDIDGRHECPSKESILAHKSKNWYSFHMPRPYKENEKCIYKTINLIYEIT